MGRSAEFVIKSRRDEDPKSDRLLGNFSLVDIVLTLTQGLLRDERMCERPACSID